MNKAIAVICIILGVILLVGFAFGIYVLLEATDCFKSKPTDFWVTVDGNRYSAFGSNLAVFDKPIQVHYLIDWLSEKQGYSYKIVPTGENFTYSVDGNECSYLDLEDLTSAFEVNEYSNGLIIRHNGNTLVNVLQSLYPNQTVRFVTMPQDNFCYKLVVTSVSGKTVELTFRSGISADNIDLTPPSILF